MTDAVEAAAATDAAVVEGLADGDAVAVGEPGRGAEDIAGEDVEAEGAAAEGVASALVVPGASRDDAGDTAARPGTVTTTVAPAGAAAAGADGGAAALEDVSPDVEVATVQPDSASSNAAPVTARPALDARLRVRDANMSRSYTTTPVQPGTSRPSWGPSR